MSSETVKDCLLVLAREREVPHLCRVGRPGKGYKLLSGYPLRCAECCRIFLSCAVRIKAKANLPDRPRLSATRQHATASTAQQHSPVFNVVRIFCSPTNAYVYLGIAACQRVSWPAPKEYTQYCMRDATRCVDGGAQQANRCGQIPCACTLAASTWPSHSPVCRNLHCLPTSSLTLSFNTPPQRLARVFMGQPLISRVLRPVRSG